MCPEDTNSKINGPHIEVKCKIDTGAGAAIMPIYVFRKFYLAMCDTSGKTLKRLDADWGKNNQMLLEKPEVEIFSHIVDATGPILLGLKTLKMHGDICETSHGVH